MMTFSPLSHVSPCPMVLVAIIPSRPPGRSSANARRKNAAQRSAVPPNGASAASSQRRYASPATPLMRNPPMNGGLPRMTSNLPAAAASGNSSDQ